MSAPEKHPFPTFNDSMPEEIPQREVIQRAENVVDIALSGYKRYSQSAPGYDPGIRGEVCEDLLTVDEGMEAEAYGVGSEQGEDNIYRLIQERHRADPEFTELRARFLGAYRDWFLAYCLKNNFDYGTAIQGWEELLVEDPLGVMEKTLNMTQQHVEKKK